MQRYTPDLTTPAQLKGDKGIGNAVDDDKIKRYIRQASALWQRWTDRTFVPYRFTRALDYSHTRGLELLLDDDLLEALTVTNGDGAVIGSSYYLTQPDNEYPKHTLLLYGAGAYAWSFQYIENRITVDGWWGVHTNYPAAWGNSLDTVLNNPLTSSATSLTVASVSGLDDQGFTRFTAGDYLKIETEILYVIAVNPSANSLTVRRGAQGTTAAAHVQTTPIYVYRQLADVQFAVNEIVKWLYEHRDATDRGVQLAPELGVIVLQELPEVRELARHFKRRIRIRAA